MSFTDSLILSLNNMGFDIVHAPDIDVYWRVDVKYLKEFANVIWSQKGQVKVKMVKPLPLGPKGEHQGFEVQYYHV
ncbi:hypothetical protein MYO4S_00248 [Serratia phage 4S]|nr:hypothetical protein MYO4S_00248 [Serratia phage 4S]